MIKTNYSMGETPESSQGLGKFLGVGLVIFALWSFLSEKKPNKISIAGIKKRRSKRLFYMLDTGKGLTAVARQDVNNIKERNPNLLHAVWALTADDARALIKAGQGERYTKKLDFAGHLLNCIGWQQVVDKNGKQITRCFIMAPNCKTKACIKETEERKAEGWKPKGRKALQGVNLSCKQYVRDAYNKLRCKKFAITCNSENECGPKAPIPWKPVGVEYTPKAIKSVAKMLANEMNQSIDDTKRVMRKIKYHGGIAPYSGGYLQEEYRDIPSKYKSKEGIKLDELAQEMEMDESELVEAINKAEEARSRLPRKKSRFSVKDMMFEAESYLAKQEGGMQGIKNATVLPKNSNELIKVYNNLVDSIDKNKDSPSILRNFTDYQWLIFIAGKTLDYGRPFDKAMENAKLHLEKPKEKLIKIWAYKDPDADYIPTPITPKEAKKAEHKIAEKGGQMTLFGKLRQGVKSNIDYENESLKEYEARIKAGIKRDLSPTQERQLLSYHAKGEFEYGATNLRETIRVLEEQGYLGEKDRRFVVTRKGEEYLDEHSFDIRSGGSKQTQSKEMTSSEKAELQKELVRLDTIVKEAKKAEHKIAEKGGQMTLFGKFKKLTHTERMEHIKINKTNRANSKFNHLVDTAATKLRNEDINRHVGVDVAWDAYRDYYIKDLRQYVLDLLVEGKAHLNIPAMAISRYRSTNPIEHIKETRTIIEMAMDHPQLLKDYLKPSEKRISKPEPTEAKQERFKEEIIKRLTPITRTEEEKLEINRGLTKSRGALIPLPNEPVAKKTEHKIAEKGGQMTLFGKLHPYYFKDTGAKVFVSDDMKYHRGPAFKRVDRYRMEILDENKEHIGTMSNREIETQLTQSKPAIQSYLFGKLVAKKIAMQA